jgi:hypothetical protein
LLSSAKIRTSWRYYTNSVACAAARPSCSEVVTEQNPCVVRILVLVAVRQSRAHAAATTSAFAHPKLDLEKTVTGIRYIPSVAR